MLKLIKNKKMGDVVVSHRHATIANALIKAWHNVFYFQTMIVFRKYIVIDCKNCNVAIEKIFLTVGIALLRLFKNLESGSPGLRVEYSKFTNLNIN